DDRAAGLTAHGKAAGEDVDVMPVLVPEPELRLVGCPFTPRDAFVRPVGARPVVGMNQTVPGADVRLDLLVAVAAHLLPSLVVHDVVGLEVPVPDAFLRSGHGEREPFLAFTQ